MNEEEYKEAKKQLEDALRLSFATMTEDRRALFWEISRRVHEYERLLGMTENGEKA